MTISASTSPFDLLRDNRALLLACEAIGWLHMTGKAHPDFLRGHGKAGVTYNEKDWHSRLSTSWENRLSGLKSVFSSVAWPTSMSAFLSEYDAGPTKQNIVGFLQAAHAMSSGIEKNLPKNSAEYLGQDTTHLWLNTPFGHPIRNLLLNSQSVLQPGSWEKLVAQIERLLADLNGLTASATTTPDQWWAWRESAIGESGFLRSAFLTTLAETRIPNNDVTLWDQSYVASALFKSAVAGLVLAPTGGWAGLKQNTQWRVLTIGMGTAHYEGRAVKIGDWLGARSKINEFFEQIRKLVEVDLALGSLIYRDDQILCFTFPGERFDAASATGTGNLLDAEARQLGDEIASTVDQLALNQGFDTPPICRLSQSSRSLVLMASEVTDARNELAVPIHRVWTVPETREHKGHVCPVCQVRFNGENSRFAHENDKGRPCEQCSNIRSGRLRFWNTGEDAASIWISEVADENDRLALLSLNFQIGSWLDGSKVESLRAQSVADWRYFNESLSGRDNPVSRHTPFVSLVSLVENAIGQGFQTAKSSPLLPSLQDGFAHESDWESFFKKVVSDRSKALNWNVLDDAQRAKWLAHQLFRKNASPGRTYRFWRTTAAFFDELLSQFRELVSSHANRWRTRRLSLKPKATTVAWVDNETYAGRFGDAPFELLYRAVDQRFVTISNLARCLAANESEGRFCDSDIQLFGDDGVAQTVGFEKPKVPSRLGNYSPFIVLEEGPACLRALVPLSAVNACIEAATKKWECEFARVWDRMPLNFGVIAFPRKLPFQAVIEASRNLESDLSSAQSECWTVNASRIFNGEKKIDLQRSDARMTSVSVPIQLPDGRTDVFYSNVELDRGQLRFPHDYRTPDDKVFRRAVDLAQGDRIKVSPCRMAVTFLDSAARRFEPSTVQYLSDWREVQRVWELVSGCAPSTTSLRAVWASLISFRVAWCSANSATEPDHETWRAFVGPLLSNELGIRGDRLSQLTDAARNGRLEQALDWHLRVLKQNLEEIP